MNIEEIKVRKKNFPIVNEIGSEFWLDAIPNQSAKTIPQWLTRYGMTVSLTMSGRGAITLLLSQVTPKYKTVLLPAYICESVIQPFIEKEFKCYFYDVNIDLSPNIESICLYKDIGIFLHMGYFGFPSNSNLNEVVNHFKDQNTIIVEDITHTLFSKNKRFEANDYYIGSIRKWFGTPSGGFVASNQKMKNAIEKNEEFINLRTKALLNKGKYMQTGNQRLKELSLKQFSEAEELLNKDVAPYSIDRLSLKLLNDLDVTKLNEKRRKNFETISEGLRNINYLKPIYKKLNKNVCPTFFPILINENRNSIRKLLIDEKIYSPIHWSIPKQIKELGLSKRTSKIYDTILSIPCDQRYGINEMERVISILKNL